MSTAVERFSDAVAYHGEGPVWIGGLRFVDMLAGDIVTLDGDGAVVDRRRVGTVAASFRPRRGGGLVVGVERGFALLDALGRLETLPEIWGDPRVRMNDGATDPDGRFYCGSMAYDVTPGAGALYRLDPGGAVSVVLDAVTISNGLAWTPDGRTAYYVDSPTQRIDVFDYDAQAGLINRRPFVTVAERDGLPDGLTVDREGGVWVALFGGAAVRRYGSGGTLDEVLDLPVTQVTACTFGGDGLQDLYTVAKAEGLRGNAARAGHSAHAAPTQAPGQDGLAARMLLVPSGRELSGGKDARLSTSGGCLAPPRVPARCSYLFSPMALLSRPKATDGAAFVESSAVEGRRGCPFGFRRLAFGALRRTLPERRSSRLRRVRVSIRRVSERR